MKILLAYDDGPSARSIINDLSNAGLPREGTEALVISVADVFIPPRDSAEASGESKLYEPESFRRAHQRAGEVLEEVERKATEAAQQIREIFPHWNVQCLAVPDSPAWAIIRKADEWHPDLLVLGSKGIDKLAGRVPFGSISQTVFYEAPCSVRIAREPKTERNTSNRIVVGVDGSPNSFAALDACVAREWPPGTEVFLVMVSDAIGFIIPELCDPPASTVVDNLQAANVDRLREVIETKAASIKARGLKPRIVHRTGKPKRVLLEEAERIGADMIFVGAKGVRGIQRLLLGSVSAAVAARANCSVEIIRC